MNHPCMTAILQGKDEDRNWDSADSQHTMPREDVQKDMHVRTKKIISCLFQMAKESFGTD